MLVAPLTIPIALIRTRHPLCINIYLTFSHGLYSDNTQSATLLLCLEVVVTLQRLVGSCPFAMYYLDVSS